MILNKLSPQGYCQGVIKAIKIALDNNKYPKPIYSLGPLIHNKEMIKELNEHNIITLDSKKTRLEMIDSINKGTIIISAHGVSPKVYEKALSKNLYIVDTTCKYVLKTHEEIKKYLSLGYDIFYIGTKNHPECEGALGISDNIKLITSINDINNLDILDKSIFINQTTLSLYDLKSIHEAILKKNPNVTILNSICMATTLRQKAVIDAKKVDLTIVIGDKSSSNTKKLFELAKLKNEAITIEKVNDLYNYDFSNINEINITSGASTPKYIVDEVISFLKDK